MQSILNLRVFAFCATIRSPDVTQCGLQFIVFGFSCINNEPAHKELQREREFKNIRIDFGYEFLIFLFKDWTAVYIPSLGKGLKRFTNIARTSIINLISIFPRNLTAPAGLRTRWRPPADGTWNQNFSENFGHYWSRRLKLKSTLSYFPLCRSPFVRDWTAAVVAKFVFN